MRAVIDANVFVAALLWRGPPHALLEHMRAGTLSMVSSPALLTELADVIGRAKFDDDQVLALALAAKVDPIVSGDNDLLSLGTFEGIPILAPAKALGLVEKAGKG